MNKPPIWKSKSSLDDGKFHKSFAPLWPGYIDNPNYPLMFVNSLTHSAVVNGVNVITNKWSGTDGPKEFDVNVKKMPLDWIYRTKEIVYNVNQSGYRTFEFEEVDWKNAIVLFGDSCTFGIGVADDETIPHFLTAITGKQVVNLGVPGGSNELIIHLVSLLFSNFGAPYAIGTLWSAPDRFRFYTETHFSDVGSWIATEFSQANMSNADLMLQAWSGMNMIEQNAMVRNYFYGHLLTTMCKDKCKLATGSYFDTGSHYTRSDFFVPLDFKARDLLHPGPEANKLVAEKLAKLFDERVQ